MELTKSDSQMIKGVAIIGMVILHLFCRLGELPYSPLIWIGNVPLVYYLGLFGDMCVPLFCFCSGYAHILLSENLGKQYKNRIPKKLIRFMCNYWIVLILFTVISFLFGKQDIIPKSICELLGNIFLYKLSYNGAWWFVLTYVILLLLSPMCIYIVKKFPRQIVIICSSMIYIIAYLLRFRMSVNFKNVVIDWIVQQSILVGTSQYGYIIGMIFRENKWVTELRELSNNSFYSSRKIKYALSIIVVSMFGGHCVVQSAFLAPFTALATLIALFTIELPKTIRAALIYLGKHSTNIWLVHMFFYMNLFNGLVFVVKYPALIVTLMFALCIVVSLSINVVFKMVCKWIDNSKWL